MLAEAQLGTMATTLFFPITVLVVYVVWYIEKPHKRRGDSEWPVSVSCVGFVLVMCCSVQLLTQFPLLFCAVGRCPRGLCIVLCFQVLCVYSVVLFICVAVLWCVVCVCGCFVVCVCVCVAVLWCVCVYVCARVCAYVVGLVGGCSLCA